jgi:hypothetical protein
VSRAAPQPITGHSRKNWFFATSTPGSTQHHTFQVLESSIHLFSQLPKKSQSSRASHSGYTVSLNSKQKISGNFKLKESFLRTVTGLSRTFKLLYQTTKPILYFQGIKTQKTPFKGNHIQSWC